MLAPGCWLTHRCLQGSPLMVVHHGGPAPQCPGLALNPKALASKLSRSLESQVSGQASCGHTIVQAGLLPFPPAVPNPEHRSGEGAKTRDSLL